MHCWLICIFVHVLIIRNSKSNEHFCRCSKGCIKNKRKRREVTRDVGDQEESTNKIILTGGPVVFEVAKEDKPLDHRRFSKKNSLIHCFYLFVTLRSFYWIRYEKLKAALVWPRLSHDPITIFKGRMTPSEVYVLIYSKDEDLTPMSNTHALKLQTSILWDPAALPP